MAYPAEQRKPDPAAADCEHIYGMTGAGVARGDTELGAAAIELRSVNSRGLAIKLRLPSACQGLEAAMEQRVRARLRRGQVTVVVEIARRGSADEPVLDRDRAIRAAASLRELADELGLTEGPRLADVLAIAGVLADAGPGTRVSWPPPAQLSALLDRALDALVTHRAAEGQATGAALATLLSELGAAREAAAARAPAVVAAHRERLLSRVNELLAGQRRALEDRDILREVALLAERIDIREELQRLGAHLDQAGVLLAKGGEVGRKLEFLAQEMLREVNTLGSKSPDTEIAHLVVAMKAAIDQVREQTANLE